MLSSAYFLHVPTFSEKLRRLMRTRGETTRSLGGAVGVSSAAVTGWSNGAVPRPDMARRIGDHFGLPVDVLLDDTLDLPDPKPKLAPAHYMIRAPIQSAARAADRIPGDQATKQLAFETYLSKVRELREEAERLAGGDIEKAIPIFDRMLAAWMAAIEAPKSR